MAYSFLIFLVLLKDALKNLKLQKKTGTEVIKIKGNKMKTTIIALMLCITIPSYVHADHDTPQGAFELSKTMKCSTIENLIDYLATNYNERVSWVGKDIATSTHIAIYRNEKSGSWTMIQYDSKVGCVLGAGELGTPI